MLAIPAGAGCGLNLVALGPISWGWERGCGPVDVRLDDACPWPNGPRPWPGIFTASPADVTSRSSCPGGLPEAKKPGQQSSFWPCTSCLTIMIKPAAEGGGQPIRGRGVEKAEVGAFSVIYRPKTRRFQHGTHDRDPRAALGRAGRARRLGPRLRLPLACRARRSVTGGGQNTLAGWMATFTVCIRWLAGWSTFALCVRWLVGWVRQYVWWRGSPALWLRFLQGLGLRVCRRTNKTVTVTVGARDRGA